MREAHAASGGRLTRLWADSAYRGLVAFGWVLFDLAVEVVTRREVISRRWVVERTFGWRRPSRNSEHTPASSKAVVQVALIGIMTRMIDKMNKC